MIDVKILRADPESVRNSQRVRGEDPKLVDQLLAVDDERRSAIVEFERLRAEQNLLSKSVGSATGDEKTALLESSKELANNVKAADARRATVEETFKEILLKISNIIDPLAPVGSEADFVVLEKVGIPRDFTAEGFKPKDHVELGKILKAIDTERGAKVSGARFYYLTGVGALLEFALVNYAISSAVKAGFIPIIPPVLVKPPAMEGTGFLGQAAENVFHLEADDFYLVGTSEVPLAAYHMDEILDSLPIRYAGYSTCFRREAGTYGKDTRGIIRVHQFDKVEMFTFTTLEAAPAEHQRLLQWEKDFLMRWKFPIKSLTWHLVTWAPVQSENLIVKLGYQHKTLIEKLPALQIALNFRLDD
jgi:seryl-tRNA synthetase